MAAWRYEISLRVLKIYFTRSLRSLVKYFFTTKREISYPQVAGHIMSYLSYKHQ